jgi:tetratricopeptide (TPR) repeat protein
MSHPRTAILPIVLLALAVCLPQGFAQSSVPGSDLKDGIDQLRNNQYDRAILLFHNVILDPNAGAQKAAAYLLIAKSYMAVGKLDDAEHNLEFYLATYPGAPDYEEASYQKARLLFMQEDFESAIQVVQAFIAAYPRSAYLSSAWFWAAESMYGLGRLDEASSVYQKIITDFPTSAKVEAAQYKVSLIQLRKKEVELTRLLKWSHEELLRSVEEYQNRERAYVQAIEAYQKRLASSSADEDRKVIADLQQQLAKKTDEAAQLAAQLKAGGSLPAAASTPAPAAADQTERLRRMLAAKEAALALKEKYLLWIAGNEGAGK